MRYAWASVTVVTLGFAATAVMAGPGDEIGSAVKVVNSVTAQLGEGPKPLATGDGVRQDELIAAAADAQGELKFRDETKLAIGPGSRIKLDRFIYDPDKTGGSIALNLVKGTFRFITGVAHKPVYSIKTPTASITVRGTIFDIYVQDDGMTWLLLHEGAITICNARGKCRDLDEPGKLIRVTDNGDVGVPVRWAGLPGSGNVPFDTAFPFVVAPPSIDPNPILGRDDILGDGPKVPGKPQRTEAPGEESGDEKPGKPSKPDRAGKPKPSKDTQDATSKPPKKTKPVRNATTDENVQVMDGMGIVLGTGLAIGKIKGGNKGSRGSSDGNGSSRTKMPGMNNMRSKPN